MFFIIGIGTLITLIAQSYGDSEVEVVKEIVNGGLQVTKKHKLMPVSEDLEQKNVDKFMKFFTTLYEPI